MTPRRIKAMRLMSDEFLAAVEATRRGDAPAAEATLALLGGALAGFVPELLDEIERIGAPDQPTAAGVVTFDRRRSNA